MEFIKNDLLLEEISNVDKSIAKDIQTTAPVDFTSAIEDSRTNAEKANERIKEHEEEMGKSIDSTEKDRLEKNQKGVKSPEMKKMYLEESLFTEIKNEEPESEEDIEEEIHRLCKEHGCNEEGILKLRDYYEKSFNWGKEEALKYILGLFNNGIIDNIIFLNKDSEEERDILNEKLPKDLADVYKRDSDYADKLKQHHSIYRIEDKTDFENADYKEITPEEAIELKKQGKITEIRAIVDGALVIFREDGYPLRNVRLYDRDQFYTNRKGDTIKNTREMPFSHVMNIASKIYQTNEDSVKMDPEKLKRRELDDSHLYRVDYYDRYGNYIPAHGNMRSSGDHNNYNSKLYREILNRIETIKKSLQNLTAKYEAGDISRKEYENTKSRFEYNIRYDEEAAATLRDSIKRDNRREYDDYMATISQDKINKYKALKRQAAISSTTINDLQKKLSDIQNKGKDASIYSYERTKLDDLKIQLERIQKEIAYYEDKLSDSSTNADAEKAMKELDAEQAELSKINTELDKLLKRTAPLDESKEPKDDLTIEEYLNDIRMGEGYVTIEKIEMDIDEAYPDLKVEDIIEYALKNEWKLKTLEGEGLSLVQKELDLNEDRGRPKKVIGKERLLYKQKRDPLGEIIYDELLSGEQGYREVTQENGEVIINPTSLPSANYDITAVSILPEDDGFTYIRVIAEDLDAAEEIAKKYNLEYEIKSTGREKIGKTRKEIWIKTSDKDWEEPYFDPNVPTSKNTRKEDLDEAVIITDVERFSPSSEEATQIWSVIKEAGKLDAFDKLIEEMFEDIEGRVPADEVESLLINESDWVFKMLGI